MNAKRLAAVRNYGHVVYFGNANRAVVIGGGVVGVTTAAALARRGLHVTLIERSQAVAGGATARNGAQLSYSYVDALGAPSILCELPKLLAGWDPAFRIYPNLSPTFLSWGLQFLGNCTRSRFIANTLAVLRLALRSRDALAELTAYHPGLDFNHAASGKVHIYDSVEKFAAAKALVRLKNEFGCHQRTMSLDELLALEPTLAACERRIVGAVYSPIDEAGDSRLFTRALAARMQREYGVVVQTSSAAEGFLIEDRRARAVITPHGPVEGNLFVLAAGADAPALARTADIRLPIYPLKGYSITLPATENSPSISVTDAGARIVFCRLQDQLRIAGMAQLGRGDNAVERRRIDALMNAGRTCLPAAADWHADPASWSGLRPMTPDCRPIIGATPITNLFLNCGHGMLGWTLACGSAELLATLIVEERPPQEIRDMANDFTLARFGR